MLRGRLEPGTQGLGDCAAKRSQAFIPSLPATNAFAQSRPIRSSSSCPRSRGVCRFIADPQGFEEMRPKH